MEIRCGKVWFFDSYLTFDDDNKLSFGENGKRIKIIATLPKDTTKEQAKKIMLDRVAKFKAERAGL